MGVERIAADGIGGLHRHPPATFDALFEKRRQGVLELRFRQMVEEDLGQDARPSRHAS